MSNAAPSQRRASGLKRRSSSYNDRTSFEELTRTTPTDVVSIAESAAVQDDSVHMERRLSSNKSIVVEEDDQDTDGSPTSVALSGSVKYLILLCAYLTSMSFGITQVSILLVFRLMTCDAYYDDHPDQATLSWQEPPSTRFVVHMLRIIAAAPDHPTDRCSIRPIESSTALSISLLGLSTTVFGIINLFITGSMIKRLGVKRALLIQVFFPAVRLLIQNIGVQVWGRTGIIIIQCSQIASFIGGPSGYLLALNTFITDAVDYEARTAWLGRVAGCMMAGSATGFLLGGLLGDAFGIRAPFRTTLASFLIASLYVAIFLPYVPPVAKSTGSLADSPTSKMKKKRGCSRFLGPLAVFAPRQFVRYGGVVRTEYGAFLLAWGVFLGILATGYLQTLLQLYATDVFNFGAGQNGWLIFVYSLLRGVFLTFAFPKLIALGRKYTTKSKDGSSHNDQNVNDESEEPSERRPLLSTQDHESDEEQTPQPKQEQFTFDLTYTRFSLLADGMLTLLCSLVYQGWQLYLVAVILPFAAGTGSAAKGSILQMMGRSATSEERTDALAGVSLVENMARLSTTFAFGVIFAAFASIGRLELVFTVNAAVALVGFGVLLFAKFPPEGSYPFDKEEEEVVDTTT